MGAAWYDALRAVPGALGGNTTPTVPSTPPASTSPTPSSNPTTPPTLRPGGACTATLTVVGQWPGGFQADVRVVNGGSAVTAWSVAWTPSGYTVNQAWNADVTAGGTLVVARNTGWNGALPAGGTVEFGFLATGTTPAAPLLTCTA
jgi:chitin-binding protein